MLTETLMNGGILPDNIEVDDEEEYEEEDEEEADRMAIN